MMQYSTYSNRIILILLLQILFFMTFIMSIRKACCYAASSSSTSSSEFLESNQSESTTSDTCSTIPIESRIGSAYLELEQLKTSIVFSISQNGSQPIVKTFGKLKETKVIPDDIQIDLGSITKMVTAVMVLKLVDMGKLQLNETLKDIYPHIPQDKANITIHHLLTHTSGLVNSFGSDYERLTKDAFLKRLFRRSLNSIPGEVFDYSNVGFSVLAAIIEERASKSYESFLLQDILRNTGLTKTGYASVYQDNLAIRSNYGLSLRRVSWLWNQPYWNLLGNGGMISTASEIVRFLLLFNSGYIISDYLVAQSKSAHVKISEDEPNNYGYGIIVRDDPQLGRFYWHSGANDVFTAEWNQFPNENIIIFAAAVDSRRADAEIALEIVRKHLFQT